MIVTYLLDWNRFSMLNVFWGTIGCRYVSLLLVQLALYFRVIHSMRDMEGKRKNHNHI